MSVHSAVASYCPWAERDWLARSLLMAIHALLRSQRKSGATVPARIASSFPPESEKRLTGRSGPRFLVLLSGPSAECPIQRLHAVGFLGTFLPFFRALDRLIAMACLRLFTLPPLPPLPLLAVPRLYRRISLSTSLPALGEYLRFVLAMCFSLTNTFFNCNHVHCRD